MRKDFIRYLAVALGSFSGMALLGSTLASANADLPFDGVEPIPAADLADLRGGFLADGAILRFGVDVTSYLDGQEVSRTVLTSGEIGPGGITLNPGSQTLHPQPEGVRISTTLTSSGAVLQLIQNTLDHKVIQTRTNITLDIVNLPALVRQPAWQGMNDLINALGPR